MALASVGSYLAKQGLDHLAEHGDYYRGAAWNATKAIGKRAADALYNYDYSGSFRKAPMRTQLGIPIGAPYTAPRVFGRRRRYVRRGRRGRAVRRRKGSTMTATNQFAFPTKRRWLRTVPREYKPPLGRLRVRKNGMQMSERAVVTKIDRYFIAPSAASLDHVIAMQSSDFWYAGALLDTPNCPDFYRTIYNWEQFRITGMKLQISTQPVMQSLNSNWTFAHLGRAYSFVNLIQPPIAMDQAGGTSADVTAYNIEAATLQPGFRYSKFIAPLSLTSPHRPRTMHRRYVRYTPVNAQNTISITGTSTNWNTIDPPPATTATVPVIKFCQPEMYQYFVAQGVQYTAGTGTVPMQFLVTKTLYLKMRNRRPPVNPTGVYASKVEPAPVALATTVMTDAQLTSDQAY